MNLEIRPDGTVFRIFDVNHDRYTGARFHTPEQAQAHIDHKATKGYNRGLTPWTLSPDMAGDNERVIRAIENTVRP